MSLLLNCGTVPADLRIKTFDHQTVLIGEYSLTMEDFLQMCYYVLTNTDLAKDDMRLHFLKCVQAMKKVPGHNAEWDKKSKAKRLNSFITPTPVTIDIPSDSSEG
jgi:hypothetical protein